MNRPTDSAEIQINKGDVEMHPLKPFLPEKAKLLMLGSFPPQKKRWCMDFYYPNYINDMWRIMGFLFFKDKDYFTDPAAKRFKQNEIMTFLRDKGIALFDTATAVRRLKDNASDKFLDIVQPTDLSMLLQQIPLCEAIVTTGQKATETLCSTFKTTPPPLGTYHTFSFGPRTIRHYRMPSSSRAYPMKLEKKTEYYKSMMQDIGLME